MGEVIYSVNGKYFKDFGIYISSSDGLFDALKRKKVNTYDWAEYHGSSLDLSAPKFEQREISLKGFVSGTNWLDMKSKFDAIISEFQKAGTQRLLVEPFGLKPLPYEVCMIDDVNLNKTFKDGKMVGVFTLKLIEPNPLKIVLYTTESTLNLSYNSPKETEIFYGNGEKDTAKGNVSASGKSLANRVVSKYNFGGRNLLRNTAFKENINNWVSDGAPGSSVVWSSSEKALYLDNGNNMGSALQNIVLPAGDYVISFDVKPIYQNNGTGVRLKSDVGATSFINIHITNEYKRYTIMFSSQAATWVALSANGNQRLFFKNIKLEKGNKATDWTPAPEDEKLIIIAGNVDEITNLTTNAQILWERL